jgi:hypothetical protein
MKYNGTQAQRQDGTKISFSWCLDFWVSWQLQLKYTSHQGISPIY